MSNTVTIQLPKCWHKLVGINFQERNDKGELTARINRKIVEVLDASNNRQTNDDPKPYYDDNRSVEAQANNGARVIIELSSGQQNYYAGCTIIEDDEEVYSETWESIDTLNEVETYEGDEYVIKVEWL